MNIVRKWLLGATAIVGLCISMIACGDKNKNNGPDFDRKAMLQNYAENLIKPAFNDLQSKVNTMKAATDVFVADVNTANLTALQQAWDAAYSSWMYANAYSFGPAGEQGIQMGLAVEIGTWPVNRSTIDSNATVGHMVLTEFNRDNRGLNAVDYLIHNQVDDNYVISTFSSEPNRAKYLAAVVNKIKSQVDAVTAEWNGTYAATFVNNNGTDAGSSTGQFYNRFIESFEAIKNFKVGIPLGKLAGQTSTEPTKVEAKYSRNTTKYLKLHLQAIDDIWHGRSKAGVDGKGWKEYLESVTNGKELVTRTETQMASIKAALNAIPDAPSFEEQITTNNEKLTTLHTELQKNVRNYKSDMSSLLGIAITFSSNDGD